MSQIQESTIKERKLERETLWTELHDVLAKMEPLKVQERAIREKIKALQQGLYKDEMLPVYFQIQKKLSEGEMSKEEQKRLTQKAKILKKELDIK